MLKQSLVENQVERSRPERWREGVALDGVQAGYAGGQARNEPNGTVCVVEGDNCGATFGESLTVPTRAGANLQDELTFGLENPFERAKDAPLGGVNLVQVARGVPEALPVVSFRSFRRNRLTSFPAWDDFAKPSCCASEFSKRGHPLVPGSTG